MLVADGVRKVPVRVLFDSGSQRSYITNKVAESLALDGPSEVLSVSMLGGETSQTKFDWFLAHLCSRKHCKAS